MTITVEAIIEELKRVQLPDGSNIVDSDMVRAVTIDDSKVILYWKCQASLVNAWSQLDLVLRH